MKTSAFIFAATLAFTPLVAAGQEDPFTDPYFNPYAPSDHQTVEDAYDLADRLAERATGSYQQRALEDQRRENSGRNSWMNMCHAMGGNATAQGLCYQAGR